jgi:hypothetical protein
MELEEKMNGRTINPGEGFRASVELPGAAIGSGFKFMLTAKCHCGGAMIPHPRKPFTWICERSRWWNRRTRHAYLVGKIDPPYVIEREVKE